MGKLALAGVFALWVAAATPAFACRGPGSEQYVVWFDLPELEPGEIALEIDTPAFRSRLVTDGTRQSGAFVIKRVLAGEFQGETIEVERGGSNCVHLVGTGMWTRPVLVGRLQAAPDAEPILLPRLMSYNHPLAIEARRQLNEHLDNKLDQ